jgi:hypothetical protein
MGGRFRRACQQGDKLIIGRKVWRQSGPEEFRQPAEGSDHPSQVTGTAISRYMGASLKTTMNSEPRTDHRMVRSQPKRTPNFEAHILAIVG